MPNEMVYTVKQLADMAGVSVRTLHYYDQVGLLKPEAVAPNGYRQYGKDAAVRLQQVMFFRELGFNLDEIKDIVNWPDFNVLSALESHRALLLKKEERLQELLATVDKTIGNLKRENKMRIKDYYQGFSDEEIEKMRTEVKERYGEDALRQSEARVSKLSKEEWAKVQAEGEDIWKTVAANMTKGPESTVVQKQIERWRVWLGNFHDYSDEMLLGLGTMYSQDKRFAANYRKYHKDMPEFMTRAIEYYVKHRTAKKK